MGKAPFAEFDVVFFRSLDFHQVAHRAGDHVAVVFKVVVVLVELAGHRVGVAIPGEGTEAVDELLEVGDFALLVLVLRGLLRLLR